MGDGYQGVGLAWYHVGRLVFAASVTQLATKIDQIMLSSAEVAAKAPFASISITGGVLADEAVALFKWRGSMIAIRAAKVALVGAVALFASLVSFGNLTTTAS